MIWPLSTIGIHRISPHITSAIIENEIENSPDDEVEDLTRRWMTLLTFTTVTHHVALVLVARFYRIKIPFSQWLLDMYRHHVHVGPL